MGGQILAPLAGRHQARPGRLRAHRGGMRGQAGCSDCGNERRARRVERGTQDGVKIKRPEALPPGCC